MRDLAQDKIENGVVIFLLDVIDTHRPVEWLDVGILLETTHDDGLELGSSLLGSSGGRPPGSRHRRREVAASDAASAEKRGRTWVCFSRSDHRERRQRIRYHTRTPHTTTTTTMQRTRRSARLQQISDLTSAMRPVAIPEPYPQAVRARSRRK
jgi:hypothetical protein